MTTFPDRSFRMVAASTFPRALAFGLTLIGVAIVATSASAQTETSFEPASGPTALAPTAIGRPSARSGRPAIGLTVSLGIRSDLVRGTGLDPFSLDDVVPQSALSISYGWTSRDRFGMALGLEWDHGESSASARGSDATLTIDRLSLGIEGRWSLTNRLVAFGRLAPGLLRDHAVLRDASAPPAAYVAYGPSALQQTSWVAAGDVSGGLALRVAKLHGLSGPVFGIWLAAEGGYGYAASHELVLAPHVETQPGRVDEPLHLGQLAFSGAFLRARVALSF